MDKIRIQIVEDEKILAEDIMNQLVSMGYTVAGMVSSGEEAIECATEKKPDLVLMDIRLKGDIDGIDAAQYIHEQLHIPVVYLTSYSDEDTLRRAKITQPYGYLLKPYEERELRAAIEVALYKYGMEKSLKEREAWLSTVLKSIHDGVIATDEKKKVMFMNPVAEKLTGWNSEDASGKPLQEVYPLFSQKTGKPIRMSTFKALKEGDITGWTDRAILAMRDGTRIPIDQSMAPIKDASGIVRGVVLVFEDITERKRLEDKMREMEKYQVFGQLASGVAHEVKNPLNAILAVTEALVQDLGEDPEYKPYLGHICTQVDRLSSLMKDMLELGRPIQPSSFQKESMSALCVSAIDLWKKTTSHTGYKVELVCCPNGDQLHVKANSAKLQQVLFNVLENAAQHSPKGSKVEIRLHEPADGYIRVCVIDRGCGIPEENLPSVVEPFFTMRSGGTGLGLSLVKRIVEQHGGSVEIRNNDPPPGCTVEVRLPVVE